MIIKSPFKDYYDFYFYNDEKDIVFVRKTSNESTTKSYGGFDNNYYKGYLDFFGQCYPFVYQENWCTINKDLINRKHYWTLEQAKECITYNWWNNRELEKFFTTKVEPVYPLAMRTRYQVIHCPMLCHTGFPSFIKPIDARNIIVQYFAQAKPEKPLPKISDEVMAEIKGFDKFSFRKDKSR